MSIGNLKDQGNQGKNFPWQLRMLNGLQAIADNTNGNTDCCNDTISLLNDIYTILQGGPRTMEVTQATGATAAGATPGDAYSLSIANVGASAGTVNGVSIPAGTTLNFDGGFNNTLDPISYNANSSTFLITYIH